MWWHRSVSTLVQVMACCLTAPSHYLNQCWNLIIVIISQVLWHSPEINFTGSAEATILYFEFENHTSEITAKSSRDQWVKFGICDWKYALENVVCCEQPYVFYPSVLTHWPLENLNVIFKKILVIDGWGISCEIAPIWMSLDFTDDQSTLVQVMAWCR